MKWNDIKECHRDVLSISPNMNESQKCSVEEKKKKKNCQNDIDFYKGQKQAKLYF